MPIRWTRLPRPSLRLRAETSRSEPQNDLLCRVLSLCYLKVRYWVWKPGTSATMQWIGRPMRQLTASEPPEILDRCPGQPHSIRQSGTTFWVQGCGSVASLGAARSYPTC